MVQVINVGPSLGSISGSMLGQALGQGLGEMYQNYSINKALEKLENDPELQNAPQSQRLSALQKALSRYGEKGQQVLSQRIGIEQQQAEEKRSNIFAKAARGESISPKEEQSLPAEDQQKLLQFRKNIETSQRLKSTLEERGMSPEVAENYANLYRDSTEGGRTAIVNHIMDLESRGILGDKKKQEQAPKEREEGEFQFPELQDERGLKPSERVKLSGNREKTNIPVYNEASQKVKSARDEKLSLRRLEQLNRSGKLPEGLFGRANVVIKNGELRIPAGANAETQLFVKTVNDFTTKAKDSYGGRVSNFELDRFMKRLPNLANTTEAREMIIKQMQIINELDNLEYDSLKKVYNHYGVGNINSQEARKIADEYKADKEKELISRYDALEGLLSSKENSMEGKIEVINPSGKRGYIKSDRLEEALNAGYKRAR